MRKVVRSIPFILLVLTFSAVLAEEPVGYNSVFMQCAIDDDGNLHLVWITADWGQVYYMKYNGSAWVGPTLLPGCSPAWPPYTNPSIEVDSDGKAHIVYGVKTGDFPDDLDIAYYAIADNPDGTSFSVEAVIGNDGYRRDGLEIVLDDLDRPHISYHKTNKFEPYWWEIIYRRPDGDERIVAHYDVEDYAGHDPCIAIAGGQLHMAWYKGSGGRNDIIYATGTENTPDYGWSSWQITNVQQGQYGNPPNIGVSPGGLIQVAYYLTDWSNPNNPYNVGVYLNDPYDGEVQIDGYAPIPSESVGDQIPELVWDNNGNRYLGWCYHGRGETYYQINNDRYTLEPAGWIDVCAGNGAWYVRTTAVGTNPGPMYFQQLAPPGPQFFPPTAVIDGIVPAQVRRGVDDEVSFYGTGFDNDENGSSILSWEWSSSLQGVLGNAEDIVVDVIDLEAGRHTISFIVQDDEGEWSEMANSTLDVFPDTIPPDSVTVLTVDTSPSDEDTPVIEWESVEDNIAIDHYDLYRSTTAWFELTIPYDEIGVLPFPYHSYTDTSALSGEDMSLFYTVAPVDVDGNENKEGDRGGAFRFYLNTSPWQ